MVIREKEGERDEKKNPLAQKSLASQTTGRASNLVYTCLFLSHLRLNIRPCHFVELTRQQRRGTKQGRVDSPNT